MSKGTFLYVQSINFLIKNSIFWYIMLFLEYNSILIVSFETFIDSDKTSWLSFLRNISPLHLIRKITICHNKNLYCDYLNLSVIFNSIYISLMFLFYFIFQKLNPKRLFLKKTKNELFYKFYVNYLDFFIRFAIIYIDITLSKIIYIIYYGFRNGSNKNLFTFYLICLFILLGFTIYFCANYYNSFIVIIPFQKNDSYPYDDVFSPKFNNFMLVAKLMSSIVLNLNDIKQEKNLFFNWARMTFLLLIFTYFLSMIGILYVTVYISYLFKSKILTNIYKSHNLFLQIMYFLKQNKKRN